MVYKRWKVILIAIISIVVGIIGFILVYSNLWAMREFSNITNAVNQKIVALTFDDGPYGDATNEILDILKEKEVKATFFIFGQKAEQYPDILRREIEEGHVIGNHSFDHSAFFAIFSKNRLIANIKKADEAIFEATGLHPKFFRPPYGLESPFMRKYLEQNGYNIVLWSAATTDYSNKEDSEAIANAILKKIKPGTIIDLHDGRAVLENYPRQNLIDALPIIIDVIRQNGYDFVTVDKILQQEPYF